MHWKSYVSEYRYDLSLISMAVCCTLVDLLLSLNPAFHRDLQRDHDLADLRFRVRQRYLG